MSGPGTVARGDPRRTACGELALLGACTAAARLDFEHAETAAWVEMGLRIARDLPVGAVMLDVLPRHALIEALRAFHRAMEHARSLPTGEPDWIPVGRAQGDLREAVTNALASLCNRALPVWTQGEAPPWTLAPAVAEEAESEGAG